MPSPPIRAVSFLTGVVAFRRQMGIKELTLILLMWRIG